MTRNLDVLLQPLEVAAEPGIDALDPRFSAITSLASRGQYAVAADQIEELLGESIYDMRLLSIYLFQAFREEGVSGLEAIFAVVERLLGESFEAIGPVKKREETFDRRFAWLFKEIADTLEYHETKQTPEWATWREGMGEEAIAAVTASMAPVAEQIAGRGLANASRVLSRLNAWLSSRAVVAGTPSEPEPSAQTAAEPAAAPPRERAAATAGGAPQADASRQEIVLKVSHRFWELTQKLRAFEALIEKRQFRKAALVADDLQQMIEHFDPRSYFPEVFAGFSAMLSENIGPLAEHWEERESIAWKALGQFYQTDLDRFIQG